VRLVEVAGGLGGAVQRRAVQRGEAAVGSTGHVGGDDVVVQLGIERAAHAVAVGRRDQPLPRLHELATVAAAHLHRAILEVAERRAQRLLVG
jgi:hypothetical protein